MPYIIETRRDVCPDCGRPIALQPSGWWNHDGLPDGCWRLSLDGPADEPARLAVATLDEARETAWRLAGWTPDAPDTPGSVHDLRRSHDGFKLAGATIGPLSDGTVVEVREVEWAELARMVSETGTPATRTDRLVAAFNAAQD